ncbi:hypothetical protein C9J03_25555 [Photobacterium gaetbulicola]|uniref:UDP-N-acetylglucosamine 1-carboxyvinyltransferase n=1 Tax=Photobacterium gaetbulicola Gung47 TaxID=658445 RepID=A0A0C5WRA3_9GAMM|nr:hypothetical protein [Photobacterium gaetbulicola]AJR05490.1 hypothetical protein H744_1c0465 [Photobacterium gaetbulicola Gung47]PST99769.1 hypothetical protein C9J03_25555 [Photobacterium gaetbulicola]
MITIASPTEFPKHVSYHLPGSKHAFAHGIACAAIADEGRISNVPNIIDSHTLIDALRLIFNKVDHDLTTRRVAFSEPKHLDKIVLTQELVAKSRNLYCLLPALLNKTDLLIIEATPQGCQIGKRPTDWYIDTLVRFGVKVDYHETHIELRWEDKKSADIAFSYPTMTGTVIAIAAASLCLGKSTISNASVEPSCCEQLKVASKLGCLIEGELPEIVISQHSPNSVIDYEVPADRIAAVTVITAGLLAKTSVSVTSSDFVEVPEFIKFLNDLGFPSSQDKTCIKVDYSNRKSTACNLVLDCGSEPKFSSDWGPFAILLLATDSRGFSKLTDDVFPYRFQFLEHLPGQPLANVNVDISHKDGREITQANIFGRLMEKLPGGVSGLCPDIRGTAAIVLSAIISEKSVTITNDFQLCRGYENLIGDLESLNLLTVLEN